MTAKVYRCPECGELEPLKLTADWPCPSCFERVNYLDLLPPAKPAVDPIDGDP